jgi:hypothetical protein
MRTAALTRGWLCLLLALAGCRTPHRDLVEAELRTKERQLRETQAELERARMINQAFEQGMVQQQGLAPPIENSAFLSPKDITLANGTGGVNDGQPGDYALEVVLVPRDEDGNPVRAVGVLTVNASEIWPGGVKTPLSTWEIGAEELRRTWKRGLIGSGYHIILKWKKPPTQQKLRVSATLVLPDGRAFEADKDISIRPMPAPVPPPPLPTPATAPPERMPVGPVVGPALP